MGCDLSFLTSTVPLFTLLFWGLPFAAGFWIWRRRKIAGASLRVGRLVLIAWFATFPLVILSLILGLTKLEGNSVNSQCAQALVMFVALITGYVALFRSFDRGIMPPASTSEPAPPPTPRNPPPSLKP